MTNETASITAQIGSRVITDARLANGLIVEKLIASDWTEAPFRLTSSHTGIDLAVKVEVTGRLVRFDSPLSAPAVRVRITFVADGDDEDVVSGGWMLVTSKGYGEGWTA